MADSIFSDLAAVDGRGHPDALVGLRKQELSSSWHTDVKELSSMNILHRLLIFCLLMLSVTSPVVAIPALSFTGGDPTIFNGGGTVGWSFSLSEAVNVTHLGFFDEGSDGFVNSHQIGIFSDTGTLLLSGAVAAGSGEPILSGFRYTNALVGTNLLAPGNYVIGATVEDYDGGANPVDIFFSPVVGTPSIATTASQVTFGTASYQGGAGLQFPAIADASFNDGFFGPNFQFSAVPEINASSATLPLAFVLGLFLVLDGRRRRLETR